MANERIRKQFAGAAIQTTLASDISPSSTTVILTAGTSYPSGTSPFVVSVGRGSGNEEKILCSARTGNNLTVLQRGYDGTVAVGHIAGEAILHVVDAYTIDQVNEMANAMTTLGDLLYRSSTGFVRRAIGATGEALIVQAGVPQWGQVADAGIGSVAPAKIMRRGCVLECVTQNVSGLEYLTMTEVSDTSGYFTSGTSVVIPAGLGGLYLVSGRVTGAIIDWHHNNTRSAFIRHEGSVNASHSFPWSTGQSDTTELTIALVVAAGDVIKIGVVDNVSAADYFADFEVWMVSA